MRGAALGLLLAVRRHLLGKATSEEAALGFVGLPVAPLGGRTP